MKVTVAWTMTLPHPLAVEIGIPTVFGPFDGVTFSLGDCDQLNWYRELTVTSHSNMPVEVVEQLHGERAHEIAWPWFDENLARVGSQINKFYMAVCRSLNFLYHPLFSGAHITVEHRRWMEVDGNIVAMLIGEGGAVPSLNQFSVGSIRDHFLTNKENVPLELLQQARDLALQGHLVAAVVSAHTALEVFCDDHFRDFEQSTSVDAFTFKSLKASEQFIDRYFHVGLHLKDRRSLKNDDAALFKDLRLLSKLRNAAAHEGALRVKEFNQLTAAQQWSRVADLVETAGWAMDWVKSSSDG